MPGAIGDYITDISVEVYNVRVQVRHARVLVAFSSLNIFSSLSFSLLLSLTRVSEGRSRPRRCCRCRWLFRMASLVYAIGSLTFSRNLYETFFYRLIKIEYIVFYSIDLSSRFLWVTSNVSRQNELIFGQRTPMYHLRVFRTKVYSQRFCSSNISIFNDFIKIFIGLNDGSNFRTPDTTPKSHRQIVEVEKYRTKHETNS